MLAQIEAYSQGTLKTVTPSKLSAICGRLRLVILVIQVKIHMPANFSHCCDGKIDLNTVYPRDEYLRLRHPRHIYLAQ